MSGQGAALQSSLDLTPIPIKMMTSEYYTNWLPIQLMNSSSNPRPSFKVKGRSYRFCNPDAEKPKIKSDRNWTGSLDFSYFRIRELMEEEKKRNHLLKSTSHHNKNNLKTSKLSFEKLYEKPKKKIAQNSHQKPIKISRAPSESNKVSLKPSLLMKPPKLKFSPTRSLKALPSKKLFLQKSQKISLKGKKNSTQKFQPPSSFPFTIKKQPSIIHDYYGFSTSASDNLEHYELHSQNKYK